MPNHAPPMLSPDGLIRNMRGHNIILDADLATLYQVDTGALVRAVKRNILRFPDDFMFQLTDDEFANLRSQIGISSLWGGRRYSPYAFTEQGVAMLSSVLRSDRAVAVNIEIMRSFVRQRHLMSQNTDLALKLTALEKKYDYQFKAVFDAIRQLMQPPGATSQRIGFKAKNET